MIPERIFLDLGNALRAYRSVVDSPSMPTPDIENAVHKLVWSLRDEVSAGYAIKEMAFEMAFQDALYEHAHLTEDERKRIYAATFMLGMAIADQLHLVKAYRDGLLPYELERLLPDDTLVLHRTPAA